MATPSQKLAGLIVSFVHDTMRGQESGLFKVAKAGLVGGLSTQLLKTPAALNLITQALVSY